jgi:uncharacterized BrkB/YihY/UPF0761 family membrane protein
MASGFYLKLRTSGNRAYRMGDDVRGALAAQLSASLGLLLLGLLLLGLLLLGLLLLVVSMATVSLPAAYRGQPASDRPVD